jgi:hypothetical protein
MQNKETKIGNRKTEKQFRDNGVENREANVR